MADAGGTTTSNTFLFADATDPGDISAYAGGNKEDDTRDWDYVNAAGPNPKTDFKHIMAHADRRGRDSADRVPRRRARRQQRDDGRRLRAEQEAVQGLPGRRAAQARPHRTATCSISLEYSNGGSNPIVTIYVIAQRRRTSRADRRSTSTQVGGPDGRDRRPQRDQLHRPREFGLRLHHPLLRLRRGVHRPLEARHHDRLPRASRPVTSAAAPAATPASSQLKDTARPFDIDLNNCGTVTIIKDAQPDSAQDFDFTTDRREQPVGLQP